MAGMASGRGQRGNAALYRRQYLASDSRCIASFVAASSPGESSSQTRLGVVQECNDGEGSVGFTELR